MPPDTNLPVTRRIAFRIALAMMPALVVVLTLFSAATAWREGEVIELEMQQDAHDVATSLALLVAHQPREEVEGRVAQVNEELTHLHVAFSEEDPTLSDEGTLVRSAAPVALSGGGQGWVWVTESLTERDAFVRRALLADLVSGLVASVVAFVFAVAVGRTVVQLRVRRLIERLRRVGGGEYPDEGLDMGRDELGTLADAVVQMTHQLREARDAAEAAAERHRRIQLQLRRADRLAAVGRTVAVFAHEVGTPLNVVVGRADRLNRPTHPEAVRKDARIIAEQADRIAAFVRRLLDYARHDDSFELVRVDLLDVLSRSVELVQDRAKGLGVRLDLQAAAPLFCEGDPRALQQVVSNLLINAAQASPSPGLVTARLRRCRCDAGVERGLALDHLHVEITDQGKGIPEELKERVFAPFFTTKDPEEGTGLGLSIVQEIVQDLGGLVSLEDPEGGGCRVIVHLPGEGVGPY